MFNFKAWLLEEEIKLGSLRDDKISGFCLHNPAINQFARKNPTQMFIVFAFVFYTIQKEWELVRQTFPEFMKWIFEKAIFTDKWSYADQSFQKFGNLLGANKKTSPDEAPYLAELWSKKDATYTNIMRYLDQSPESKISSDSDMKIFEYIVDNIRGLGAVKAAFATQLMLGKFGCLDSVNTNAYKDVIQNYVKKKKKAGKPTGFAIKKDKDKVDIQVNKSKAGLRGYVDFLKTLEDLYGDNISKILWDDWCEIVAQKVVKSGSGEKISIVVNGKQYDINPYRKKINTKDMMDIEKANLAEIDPDTTGTGVSQAHRDIILAAGKYAESTQKDD
jgi:hypothetical protein